ncbi:MAG: helix-turn-helix domain-containing protein [Crocosphaera sp.]
MSKYSATQAEEIRKIASYLNQQRVKQGLTLEDIASLTFIRLPMLKALEAADVEQLPELIYVQGFIRRYGETLKLDGYGLSHQITASQGEKTAISPNLVAPAVIGSSVGQEDPPTMVNTSPTQSVAVASQPRTLVHPSEEPSEVFRGSWFKGLQLYWLYLVILGGAIAGLFYLFSAPPAREETAQTQGTQAVTTTAKTQETTQPITKPETMVSSEKLSPILETTPETAQTTPTTTPAQVSDNITPNDQGSSNNAIKAVLQLEADSWLQVRVDGKVEYEGILQGGSQQSWDAQEKLMIRAGNAGAVKLSINNKPPEVLGELGQVKTVEVTPDS